MGRWGVGGSWGGENTHIHTHTHTHTHTLVSWKVIVISVSGSHISEFPCVLDKIQILWPSPTFTELVFGMA